MFKNKNRKISPFWLIVGVTVAFFVVIGILSAVIGIIVGAILLQNGELDPSTLEFSESGNKVMSNINLIGMFLQEIVLIIIPILAWKYIKKRPLSNMGISSLKEHSKELLIGLLFGILSISVVFAAIILSGNAVVESWTPHFSLDTILYLLLFIMVGFAEEIYGRGFIMSALRQTKNVYVVVIVSSGIFAFLHSSNSGIGALPYINLALVGALFAYMYLKSGNIWMSIGYHITWNYFQGNVFGFKVSGLATKGILTTTYESNNILNGGAFGPEGGLFVTVILLLGFLFVNRFYKDKSFDFFSTEDEVKVEFPVQGME